MPFYNQNSKERARFLRKNQTDTEHLLWQKLRGRQLGGYKFYRQYPTGHYILDFYCPAKKLVIEVDGSQHIMQKQSDSARDRYLEENGMKVVRFWNNQIFEETELVLQRILELLTE